MKLTNLNNVEHNHELDGLFSNIGTGEGGFLSNLGTGNEGGFLSKVGTGSEDGFLSKVGSGSEDGFLSKVDNEDKGFLSNIFSGGNSGNGGSNQGPRRNNNFNTPQTTPRQTQPVQTAGINLGNTELVIIGTGLALLAGITLMNKD